MGVRMRKKIAVLAVGAAGVVVGVILGSTNAGLQAPVHDPNKSGDKPPKVKVEQVPFHGSN